MAGHALIVSTDRREKPDALTLKRFERRFSKKLGLGRSPRMRIVTPGSVLVQATLTANGKVIPFSAQIASW